MQLFNSPLFQDSWVSQHQKIWFLMKQEMIGVAVASAGPYANHLHLTADR